jgi:tetratricopeptide (TPR) repeat protein
MDDAREIEQFAAGVADDLAARLVESGLYAKEARAMVNTWRTSYFTTDGIRVLFVLPQSWTDRFIPMTIHPKPDELVRVMVGRIELMAPERERAAEAAISGLASPDPRVRSDAFATLRDQGRYVEPIVRRALESSSDEQVRTLARRLLLTDFVTDIRSSLTSADDGRKLSQEPAFARAQLANVLREIGLRDEARQEGELALKELAVMPRPTLSDHASRNTYRALGRANEGAGRDAEALQWYREFVEFGSSFESQGCAWCHGAGRGPTDTSFFRDWWAGRKFAELAWRTGEAPRLIEAAEELAGKGTFNSLFVKLQLAYLYEGGDKARAERLWAQIDPRRKLDTASVPGEDRRIAAAVER